MDSQKEKQQKQNIFQNLEQSFQAETVSPYKEKYNSYFSQINVFSISNLESELSKNKIKYSNQKFHSGCILEVSNRTEKSTIVVISVYLSYFQFELTILNIDGESPGKGEGSQKSQRIGLLQQLNKGGFGQILLSVGLEQKYFVIKSIQYVHKNQEYDKKYHQNLIEKAIIEYCYYKLFSILQVGPHIENYFGFDLIVYNSTIEFAMQLCSQPEKINIDHLKSNLKIMHSLNIIHGDIKPDNVMYSPFHNKFVFVDFGLSKCLQGKPGTMTTSNYFGTWSYLCKEMLQAFQKGTSLLDLYYNDVFGLTKIQQEINQKMYIVKKNKELYPNKEQDKQTKTKRKIYINYIFNISMKRAIYDRNLTKVKYLAQKYKKYSFLRQNLELFIQLPTSKQINHIFKYLIKTYCLEGQERVTQILKYYTGKKLQINPLQTTVDFRHRYRDEVDLQKQQKNLSQAERFMLLIYKTDISARQRINKIITLQKIKQNKLQLTDPCMIMRAYVNLIQNLFTTKQQILYIFEKAKQLLKIKQWDPIDKPSLEIFIKAWQIRRIAYQKLQLDLTYQVSFENKLLNAEQLKKLEDYQKKMYSVYQKMLKALENLKQKLLYKNKSQIQPILSEMSIEVEKQYIKILKNEKNLSNLYKIYLELKLNGQSSSQKILEKLSQFKMIRKTKFFLAHYQAYSLIKIVINESYWQNIDKLLLLELNSFNSCFNPNNFLIIFFLTKVLQKSKICIKKGDRKSFNQLKESYQKFISVYIELILLQHNFFIGFNLIQVLQRQMFYLKKQFSTQLDNMLFSSQITLYHKFFYKFQENFFHQFSDYCFSKLVYFMRQKKHLLTHYPIKKQIQKHFYQLIEDVILPTLEKYYKISTIPQKKYQLVFLLISFKTHLKIITIEQALQNYQIIIEENGLINKTQSNDQIQFIHKIHRFMAVLNDQNLQKKYNILNQKVIKTIQNYLNKQNNNYPKLPLLITNLVFYYTINDKKQKLHKLIIQKLKISHHVFDVCQIYIFYLQYFKKFVIPEPIHRIQFRFLVDEFKLYMDFVGKGKGLQYFCENYGQSIIFCELFLRYFYFATCGNKMEINTAIKVINIGRMLINHNSSSFFNSRFKIITSIVSQKFIIKALQPESRRSRMALLKVLRNKQFSFHTQIQTPLKNLKKSELDNLNLIILQNKIKKIYVNKAQKFQNINNLANQKQLMKLLCQSQMTDFWNK